MIIINKLFKSILILVSILILLFITIFSMKYGYDNIPTVSSIIDDIGSFLMHSSIY